MWKYLNKLISNKQKNISDEIIFDDGPSINKRDISEKFNNFFVNSIVKINNDIPIQYMPKMGENQIVHSFNFEQVNVECISEIVNELGKKVNKSELLNSNVWRDAFEYCGHFLTNIINHSLKSGVYPDEWKKSTVIPIPKIKNTNIANNFRPINTLPNDEKVIEKVVKNQLVDYIEKNDLISQNQSAFRKNHSCETTINYLINDWKKSIEGGEKIVAVLLDLKRAFETVDRDKMLLKLKSVGIEGVELKWMYQLEFHRGLH